MPNQHRPDYESINVELPRSIKVRLMREAQRASMSMSQFIIRLLNLATESIAISARDYEAIAKATKEAERTGRRISTKLDNTP